MNAPSADAPSAEAPAPAGMKVLRGIGHGGMGAVWLVERSLHGGLTQRAVLKRPRVDVVDGVARTPDGLAQRFRSEARALSRVSHGNVVRLLDAGADAFGPWIAIEHVDGTDAHALLEGLRKSDSKLSADELAWIAHEAARGMSAAHALLDADGEPSPILHRDLSPQNLLLSRAGEVKVTDFGIAWAVERDARTTTGVVVGNLRYIAPEQLEGRTVSPATDVYGLGRVIEEFLDHTDDGPERATLRSVAQRATRRAPDERYDSMEALAEALLAASPTLARGSARLASRVRDLTRTRDRVHHALAGLLAAERPDNDRESVPHAPQEPATPTAEPPQPAPTTEPRSPATPAEAQPGATPAPRSAVAATRAVKPKPRTTVLALSLSGGLALAVWLSMAARPSSRIAPAGAPMPVSPPTITSPPAAPLATPPAIVPNNATQPAAPTQLAEPTPPPSPREEPHRITARRERAVTTADASAPLTIVATSATLRVSALPFARVSIDDGAPEGTPHAFVLAAGAHRVRARFTVDGGVVEVARDVDLSAGETRTLGLIPP